MVRMSQELAGWPFTFTDMIKMHRMFKTCQDIAMSTDKTGMMRLL